MTVVIEMLPYGWQGAFYEVNTMVADHLAMLGTRAYGSLDKFQ